MDVQQNKTVKHPHHLALLCFLFLLVVTFSFTTYQADGIQQQTLCPVISLTSFHSHITGKLCFHSSISQPIQITDRHRLHHLHQMALAKSSTVSYWYEIKCILQFCTIIKVTPLLASKDTVAMFTAHLSKFFSVATIRVYLSPASLHCRAGHSSPTYHNLSLQLVLHGLGRISIRSASARRDS